MHSNHRYFDNRQLETNKGKRKRWLTCKLTKENTCISSKLTLGIFVKHYDIAVPIDLLENQSMPMRSMS